jgi:hypothetical protein
MAKKTTDKKADKAAPRKTVKSAPKKKAKQAVKTPKVAKAPKGEPKAALPRHPRARVTAAHGTKDALAKSLADALARADEDTGVIADRLRTASNSQLLRLQSVVATVKEKYGDRAKLIEKLGTIEHKSKDKDYLAMLETLSLPNLLDLAQAHEKRARA